MSVIEGYTPCLDTLIKRYNLTCASVYGKVWRYEQMEGGKCFASQERIAEELKITRQTVNKYLGILEADGYVKKVVVLASQPREYTTTGKAGIVYKGVAYDQLYTKQTPVVNETDNRLYTKHTQRKDIKKETKKPDSLTPVVAYVELFGKFKGKRAEELAYSVEQIHREHPGIYYEVLEWLKFQDYKHPHSRVKAFGTACKNWGKMKNKNQSNLDKVFAE